LSFLSDSWSLYLLQMHGVAFLFFLVLYVPFGLHDLLRKPEAAGARVKRT